jgi:hypothetical protein
MKAYWAARPAHKQTNAGTAAAQPAETGAANEPSEKASRKAVRVCRKAGKRQEPNK